MTVRVYIPATMRGLGHLLASGQVTTDVAYAVTPRLREWYIEGDLEELEHVAMSRAARASLALLAHSADDQPRRVVLAADVPDAPLRWLPDVDLAAVQLAGPANLANLVSAHVDGPEAAADVRRAVAAYSDALRGDPDAQFAVEALEDHELAWYALQELEDLLAQS